MFTGIIEEIGTVRAVTGSGSYRLLEVAAGAVLQDMQRGDSVAIDGVCQTVTAYSAATFSVEVLAETLKKTTLKDLRAGGRVNLERSVTPTTRLGGHFVQGHVDGVGRVVRSSRSGDNVYLTVRVPQHLGLYVVDQGSIAINGVSLTVASLTGTDVTVNVIPTTWEFTTLSDLAPGDAANVETDIIGRYVARMLGLTDAPGVGATGVYQPKGERLTAERLAELGYGGST